MCVYIHVNWYMCVHVSVHLSMFIQVNVLAYVFTCMCYCRAEDDNRCLSRLLSTLSFEAWSLTELGPHHWLTNELQGSSCVSLSPVLGLQTCAAMPSFSVGVGDSHSGPHVYTAGSELSWLLSPYFINSTHQHLQVSNLFLVWCWSLEICSDMRLLHLFVLSIMESFSFWLRIVCRDFQLWIHDNTCMEIIKK